MCLWLAKLLASAIPSVRADLIILFFKVSPEGNVKLVFTVIKFLIPPQVGDQ